ncbi:right-handed parallel beta-helix repeat-containing protein [Dyadobacter sandarakinus]|uniref:Right-handed parallel beta-helix repeat-containing protein n=2 Tax=Dyadobacter sandarakinus TaxID=2747268 RepID=A0ABX7IGR7_9BACT|nr:right-handed parallel beta-helix repeat-containing protein [Dyadobacter sandarakinus]
MLCGFNAPGQDIYVATSGNDANAGTLSAPLKTLAAALARVRVRKSANVTIQIRQGTYYLNEPLVITPEVTHSKVVTIRNYQNEKVVLSAGKRITAIWKQFSGPIWMAQVEADAFEMLFVNGKQQHLARYPDYDSTARVFNGTAADALSPAITSRWKSPAGGYVHALHSGEWGSFHYKIKSITNGTPELEGGWQNNRPSPMHPKERFVENIFEELNAAGEWFFDQKKKILYLIPEPGTDLNKAVIERSDLKHLAELRGTTTQPVRNVTLAGLQFMHTKRTIMEHYEPLLRSDWMIYRGGAIVLENTENCLVKNAALTNLGGNAVMFTGKNKKSGIIGSHIYQIGSSAICFVGDSSAVRSPAFGYEQFIPVDQIDRTPGPKNDHYPLQCFARDNLIHDIGRVEKQCTGVQIEMASEIRVSHNTIYRVPRAGINIGDGAWGGHVIENNDVFDTVLETGDHGAFNSWGRDRFWHPDRKTMDSLTALHPELILLDAQKTVIIRNNRFRCDHGWDIDLDDGSSNYHIYNNVLLSGGLKFREGFYRTAENNILINNSFHPHVWFNKSGDIFRKNILMRPYFPILVKQWGKEVDYNLFPNENDLKAAQLNGTDSHSIAGDAGFMDSEHGNYQVRQGSPALTTGFQNFPMNDFGTRIESLKKIAAKVQYPVLLNAELEKNMHEMTWLGVKIRNVQGLGDRSAFGLPDEKGIVVMDVPAQSLLSASGLQNNDVIITANQEKADNIVRLEGIRQQINWTGRMEVEVMRNQQKIRLTLNLK